MIFVFSPGRRLMVACMVALVGVFLFYAAHHSPPDSAQAVRFAMGIGCVLELLAAWVAFTALRWIWQRERIFFRGPQQ